MDTLFVAAAVCGVSGGTALFVAIIVEVTGRMVLLIPRAWNKAKDLGRTEGRAEERDRVQAILSQYARRDPETGELVLDRDAEERLRNGTGNGNGKG